MSVTSGPEMSAVTEPPLPRSLLISLCRELLWATLDGANGSNASLGHRPPDNCSDEFESEVPVDGSPALRIIISLVYSVVCAVGLVGNLLVFYVMRNKQARKKSTINYFVVNLAITDFQFVLVLPFWAVETALDFNWPFGDALCRLVSSLTVLNMYASVSFLTAMSVVRYWAIASAVHSRPRPTGCSPRWISLVVWLAATAASVPTAVFSTAPTVSGVPLCLLRFPEGQFWLGVYHVQKILLGFLLPLVIISACYLQLLRFLRHKNPAGAQRTGRRSRVTRSVTVVVLSFFVCWLPNHAITLWGIFVKLGAVPFGDAFYTAHVYVFPVTVCLAHANSCLNPLLYCLLRRDYRQALRQVFWRAPSSPPTATTHTCHLRPFSGTCRPEPEVDDLQAVIQLQPMDGDEKGQRRQQQQRSVGVACTSRRNLHPQHLHPNRHHVQQQQLQLGSRTQSQLARTHTRPGVYVGCRDVAVSACSTTTYLTGSYRSCAERAEPLPAVASVGNTIY
ncbi:unnamed protein product [Lampetra planeri]